MEDRGCALGCVQLPTSPAAMLYKLGIANLNVMTRAVTRSNMDQLGSLSKRIWMSTGIYDVDVTPSYVENLAAQIKQVRRVTDRPCQTGGFCIVALLDATISGGMLR